MSSHKKVLLYDVALALMAYLIFAICLLAINIVKYQSILIGLYVVLIGSGSSMLYCMYNYSKDLK